MKFKYIRTILMVWKNYDNFVQILIYFLNIILSAMFSFIMFFQIWILNSTVRTKWTFKGFFARMCTNMSLHSNFNFHCFGTVRTREIFWPKPNRFILQAKRKWKFELVLMVHFFQIWPNQPNYIEKKTKINLEAEEKNY